MMLSTRVRLDFIEQQTPKSWPLRSVNSDTDVVRRMDEVLAALTDSDIAQSMIVVERERVRRRRLPLSS